MCFPTHQRNDLLVVVEKLLIVSPQVMDSVKAIALGLHALITEHCPDHNGNRTMLKHCANGPRLLRYIRNVSFEGYSAKTVSFDDNGDLIGGYLIKQVRLTANGEYTHDVIGESSYKPFDSGRRIDSMY